MATELVAGIHDITCRETPDGRYRAFLVTGPEPILFDCGFPDTADVLLDELADLPDPEHLVVTHADGDHVGGFDAVVEAYDPTTHVPEGAELDAEATPDHRYTDGHTVAGFVAVETPGHRTPHYSFVDEERGVCVLGDAASGADQRGLPEGYFHLPPGWFSEDLVEAERSLVRLLDYEFDVGLVYHGSSVLADADEKLTAYVERWREFE